MSKKKHSKSPTLQQVENYKDAALMEVGFGVEQDLPLGREELLMDEDEREFVNAEYKHAHPRGWEDEL